MKQLIKTGNCKKSRNLLLQFFIFDEQLAF